MKIADSFRGPRSAGLTGEISCVQRRKLRGGGGGGGGGIRRKKKEKRRKGKRIELVENNHA